MKGKTGKLHSCYRRRLNCNFFRQWGSIRKNSKNYWLLLLIFIIVQFQNGCNSNSTGPPDEFEDILPLALGNKWIYQIDNYFDSKGNVVDHITEVQYDTMEVVRDTMIGNERWFAIRHSIDANTNSIGENYYVNRADGIYILTTQQFRGSYQYPSVKIFLKYPMEIGDSITFMGEVKKLIAISDSVTINSKNYFCYIYEISNIYDSTYVPEPERHNLIYLSPQIGFVRGEYIFGGRLAVQSNLLSYELN